MTKGCTYYSSYIYLFAGISSFCSLGQDYLSYITCCLFLSSIICHSDRDNIIKLRIDEIIVRITTLSYAYYFYNYWSLWFALIYMILSYYILKSVYPNFADIIHSSFHIVTGFTMIYLVIS